MILDGWTALCLAAAFALGLAIRMHVRHVPRDDPDALRNLAHRANNEPPDYPCRICGQPWMCEHQQAEKAARDAAWDEHCDDAEWITRSDAYRWGGP